MSIFSTSRRKSEFSLWYRLFVATEGAHLSGSDTAALGGDLAYQYGKSGPLTGIGLTPAQDVINSAQFGSSAQTLRTLAELQQGQIRLS
ncbi:MAG: hypothetical protein HY067_02410 [Betaproteobacteria bacterium]|nr:hypothetical protein [Betaproteobacteria bacterium]